MRIARSRHLVHRHRLGQWHGVLPARGRHQRCRHRHLLLGIVGRAGSARSSSTARACSGARACTCTRTCALADGVGIAVAVTVAVAVGVGVPLTESDSLGVTLAGAGT